MKRKREKNYSTGEFAQYFGISKDTLLYYDRIGLFSPKYIAPNGYRQYSASQISTFSILLSLREMNVSIQEIRQYLSEKSPERFSEIIGTQLHKLDLEIQRLEEIRQGFCQNAETIRDAQNAPLEQVIIQDLPEKYLVYHTSPFPLTNLDENRQTWWDACSDFIKKAGIPGIPYVGSYIDQNCLQSGRFNQVNRLFMWANHITDNTRPAGTYAVLYHKGSYDTLYASYTRLLQEIQKRQYRMISGAFEEYLLDDLEVNTPEEYVTKISVRVQSMESTGK